MYKREISFFAAVLVLGLLGIQSALAANDQAKAILDASGVKAGFCVHVGSSDGSLIAKLAKQSKLLVHGLALDSASVGKARQQIQSEGIYGQASVELLRGKALPYADNLVNLLIVEDLPSAQGAGITLKEMVRVVCPNGTILVRGKSAGDLKKELTKHAISSLKPSSNGTWTRVTKPRPSEMGEWNHPNGGPGGNMVSEDSILEPPTGLRWIAGPTWPRGPRKRHITSTVSGDGRLFHVTVDVYSNLAVPLGKTKWYIVARDAFNGLHLWKHPFEGMGGFPRGYKAQEYHKETMPPLVAVGNKLYTAGEKTVQVLDPATGKLIRQSEELEGPPDTIAYVDGHLLAVTHHHVYSIDPATGKIKWKAPGDANDFVAGDGSAFFLDVKSHPKPYELVSLDLETGRERWRKDMTEWWAKHPNEWWPKDPYDPKSKAARKGPRKLIQAYEGARWKKMAIRAYKSGVLILTHMHGVRAVAGKDGQSLWYLSTPFYERNQPNRDALIVNGAIWLNGGVATKGAFVEIDLMTGKERKRVLGGAGKGGCQNYTATKRLVLNRNSCIDIEAGTATPFQGARGVCKMGTIPANGLAYTGPYGCGCLPGALRGFMGLAANPIPASLQTQSSGGNGGQEKKTGSSATMNGRLIKGPAFAALRRGKPAPGQSAISHQPSTVPDDWPMLRHDAQRSGKASTLIPADPKQFWSVQIAGVMNGHVKYDWGSAPSLGDPITPPVIAGGRIFLALQNTHQVVALDAETGKRQWAFTAGGRVNTPPAIHGGLCLFGSQDGWVYCLNATDGKLAWQFRAAPEERRIVAFGQVESLWPVPGGVLINNGLAYFTAGRSIAVDGGVTLFVLEPQTGKVVWERMLPFDVRTLGMGRGLLVGDEKSLYIGKTRSGSFYSSCYRFDLRTGKEERLEGSVFNKFIKSGNIGMLDGSWRRQAGAIRRGSGGWSYGKLKGFMLVFDGDRVFYYHGQGNGGRGDVRIVSSELTAVSLDEKGEVLKDSGWSIPIDRPFQIEAMLLAGKTLFIAGPPNGDTPSDGVIWALSTADGRKLNEIKLAAPPVFDGMAAANERLYISTQDGKLLCFGKK